MATVVTVDVAANVAVAGCVRTPVAATVVVAANAAVPLCAPDAAKISPDTQLIRVPLAGNVNVNVEELPAVLSTL